MRGLPSPTGSGRFATTSPALSPILKFPWDSRPAGCSNTAVLGEGWIRNTAQKGRRVPEMSAQGLPVRVVAVIGGQLELQSLASDSRLYVPAGYPLVPMTEPNLAVARKAYPQQACRPAAGISVRTNKPLAPIIDAMLLTGGKTMRGIVRELRRKASLNGMQMFARKKNSLHSLNRGFIGHFIG